MKNYNGIEITEGFYDFFAPYFVNLISHIQDPREADNANLTYTLSSYLPPEKQPTIFGFELYGVK